jgi:excisionase family DNA binding protein
MVLERALNVAQVAKRFGIHRATVIRAIKKGTVPAYKVGHNWRIDEKDLDSFKTEKAGN